MYDKYIVGCRGVPQLKGLMTGHAGRMVCVAMFQIQVETDAYLPMGVFTLCEILM